MIFFNKINGSTTHTNTEIHRLPKDIHALNIYASFPHLHGLRGLPCNKMGISPYFNIVCLLFASDLYHSHHYGDGIPS